MVRRGTRRERTRRRWWWWEVSMMRRERRGWWGREMVRRASRNVLAVTTLSRLSVLGERTNDVPDSLCNLPSRIRLRRVEVGLNVGSGATNFLRSATELITVRSPISAVPDVLHDIPQRSGELGVLCERSADDAEECSDIAGESRSGPSGKGIDLCERRIWSIVSRRGGRWNFLDVDSSIGERDAMARNLVNVDRRFLWGLVGENRVGR